LGVIVDGCVRFRRVLGIFVGFVFPPERRTSSSVMRKEPRSSAISDQLTSRTGPVTSPYLFVRRCAPSSSPSNPQQVQSALNSVQRSFIAPNIAFYEDWVCWILWHFIAPVGSQRFFELVNFGRTKPKRKASDQHKSACRSTYVKLLTAKVNYGVFTKC
jgi:hypothetical protein